MHKMKLLPLILSLLLVIGVVPATVSAEDTGNLWVNGVDIIAAPGNVVSCGSGTASYDPGARTLTLSSATISTGHNGAGILIGDYFSDREVTIVLIGASSVVQGTTPDISRGIFTMGLLSIRGPGSISIDVEEHEDSTVFGIFSFKGCSITDAIVSLSAEPVTEGSSIAIDSSAMGGYLKCNNAVVSTSGYTHNINVPSGRINIEDSEVTIANGFKGINGGLEIDDFKIRNSEIICSVSGEPVELPEGGWDYPVAIANGHNVLINSSKLTVSSTSSNAIFTEASLIIENRSEIDASGFHPALFGWTSIYIDGSKVKAVSTGDSAIFTRGELKITGGSDICTVAKWCGMQSHGEMTIRDSCVEAVSTNDIGIFSRSSISIDESRVHAKGGEGFAAMAARIVLSTDEVARSTISYDGLMEMNGGKTAFSDWFLHSSGETRSWTSLIPEGATCLEVNGAGAMINALNEIWLGENICAFGHHYDEDFTVDAEATCTTDGSKSRHCSHCDERTEVTIVPATGHTKSDWIVDKEATYEEAGSRHKECTVCKVVLETEAIAKLPSKDVIENPSTGIKVEYEDGSVFDDAIELVVTLISKDRMDELEENVDKVAKGLKVVGLYDIKLIKNGVAVQPDGKTRVSIPLTDEMRSMSELKVIYIDENGDVIIIPSEIIDGKLVFVTDHFSQYGVIGNVSGSQPDDGSVYWIGLLLCGIVVIGIIAFIIFKRKR